jgi:hypothetical protein
MNGNPNHRESLLREAKFGACVWMALAASSMFPASPLGIVEVLFLSAPWVLVPLGMSLLLGISTRPRLAG